MGVVCLCVGGVTFPSCELGQGGVYHMEASNSCGKVEREVRLTVLKEEEVGHSHEVGVADREEVGPLSVEAFGDYVANLHGNSNKLFKTQFSVRL